LKVGEILETGETLQTGVRHLRGTQIEHGEVGERGEFLQPGIGHLVELRSLVVRKGKGARTGAPCSLMQ
jgi:hypothetical protein